VTKGLITKSTPLLSGILISWPLNTPNTSHISKIPPIMLRPRGRDHGTCASPPSEPEDTTPALPGSAAVAAMSSVVDPPDLFHLSVLLAENLNNLKQWVNAEQQAH